MPINRKELGNRGEEIAVDYMRSQGFKIVEKNFRCKFGEIDLIAQKNDEIYFIEVKTRKNNKFGDPLESITAIKQMQIIKIAKYFLLKYKKEVNCHFSAVGITLEGPGEASIKFLPDAFQTA